MSPARSLLLAASAGLALSAGAAGQYAVVSNLPGSFVPGVDVPGNFIPGSRGDDLTVVVNIPAPYASAFIPAGPISVDSNGRITTEAFSVYTNTPLSAASPPGLYPHWDDLYTDDYTESGIYAADLGTMFVIQWNADPYDWEASGYPAGYPTANAKLQVQILPSGGPVMARYAFQGMGTMSGQSATIGAVTTGGLPIEYSYNTAGAVGDSVVLSVIAATTGACCRTNGTCIVTTSEACTAGGGTYRGDNSACATANCPPPPGFYVEQGDAGSLPGNAAVTTGSGSLTTIVGSLGGEGDADTYRIRVCDEQSFSASTVGQSEVDTQLFLFSSVGRGVVMNDDEAAGFSLQSTITSALVFSTGTYYLSISGFDHDPTTDGGLEIWLDMPYGVERAPDGPGAADAIGGWFDFGDFGSYRIVLTGACYAESGTCYPNCDGSTTAPVLNVQDFTCFLQRYASGDSYANCDDSTTAPVLNVQDFTCFLQSYAAGCP